MRVEGEKAAVILSRIVSSIGVVEVDDILDGRVVLSGEKRRRESRPGALRRGSIDG
jgi:hypothetical protein